MADIQELIQQVKSALVTLEEDAVSAQYVVAERSKEVNKINDLVVKTRDDFFKLEAKLKKDNKELEDRNQQLLLETENLKKENTDLIGRKSKLLIENTQLQKANDQFKRYEDSAWMKLEAKDNELQEREKTVSEKENYSPRGKSFLPPLE